MSDYRHEKVLRYPVSEDDLNHYGVDDVYELVDSVVTYTGEYKIEAAPTEGCFLDLVLFEDPYTDKYDFGYAKELTSEQQEKYKPYFEQYIPNIDMNKVHYVDFCWYNCSEAPDYYKIEKLNI